MIKLKELIKDEIISKIINEDQDSDGTIEGGYDDGDTWKSPSGQYGGKYKGQIQYFDDEDNAKDYAKSGTKDSKSGGSDKKDKEDEPGKLKGGDFDREADKDDEKEKLQKQIEDLENKVQKEMELVARGVRDEEDVMALVNKLDDLEDKLADMD